MTADISPKAVFSLPKLIFLGAFLTGIGVLASLILSRFDQPEIEIMPASDSSNSSSPSEVSAKEGSAVIVDVSGAVLRPGVYSLSADARFSDALSAAGGLAERSDREYVSKYLNLAQKISDGSKIYIPFQGESAQGSSSEALKTPNSLNAPVSINNSSLSDLDTLSGIGAVRAQAIIDGRPYGRLEELVERKIISQSVFDKIKGQLTL